MGGLRLTVRRTENTAGLRPDGPGIVWSGPLEEAAGAPCVEWRLEGAEGDGLRAALGGDEPALVGDWVARLPMPWGLVRALARECMARAPARCAEAAREPQERMTWAQALAEALPEPPSPPRWEEPEELHAAPEGMHVSHVRALPDGSFALLTIPDAAGPLHEPQRRERAFLVLFPVGRLPISLPIAAAERSEWCLPAPVAAEAGRVAVSVWQRGRRRVDLWVMDGTGSRLRHACGASEESPHGFSEAGEALWVHGERRHLRLVPAEDGAPDPEGLTAGTEAEPAVLASVPRGSEALPGRFPVVGGRLVVLEPRQVGRRKMAVHDVRFVDPAGGAADVVVRYPGRIGCSVASEDAMVVAGEAGAMAARLDGSSRRYPVDEQVDAVATEGKTVWLAGHGTGVASVDAVTGERLWRTALDFPVRRLDPVPGGVVASCGPEWDWLLDDGSSLLRPVLPFMRGTPTVARRADGVTAFAAGEYVVVIGADVTVRQTLRAGYRVALEGCVGDRFVLRPDVWGDVGGRAPVAFFALDGDGELVARVPWREIPWRHWWETRDNFGVPVRRYCGGSVTKDGGALGPDAVFLLSGDARRLHRWEIGESGAPDPMPEERRPHERTGERVAHGAADRPKDDVPLPGIVLGRGRHFVSEGCYGGTTGALPGEAAIIRDEASAVFFRCRFTAGGGRVEQRAIAFLVDCELAPEPWVVDEGCALVLVNCRVPPEARILAAPGAVVVGG